MGSKSHNLRRSAECFFLLLYRRESKGQPFIENLHRKMMSHFWNFLSHLWNMEALYSEQCLKYNLPVCLSKTIPYLTPYYTCENSIILLHLFENMAFYNKHVNLFSKFIRIVSNITIKVSLSNSV